MRWFLFVILFVCFAPISVMAGGTAVDNPGPGRNATTFFDNFVPDLSLPDLFGDDLDQGQTQSADNITSLNQDDVTCGAGVSRNPFIITSPGEFGRKETAANLLCVIQQRSDTTHLTARTWAYIAVAFIFLWIALSMIFGKFFWKFLEKRLGKCLFRIF